MLFFAELGQLIERRFRARDYDEAVFHEVAAQALLERPPSRHVGLDDVVEHLFHAPEVCVQHDLPFGEPPVVVFRSDAFYIEVLPWLDGTTAIHQHGFSGAFHVLSGSSIHTRFSFETTRRFSERLAIGELGVQHVELLTQGDVRPIPPGNAFIHSLFHLHRPSISVVVRTHSDMLSGPQLSYGRHSGVAWDPFHKPPRLEKQLRLFRLLHDMEHPRFAEHVATFLRESDAFAGLSAVLALAELVRPFERFEAMAREWTSPSPDLFARALAEVRGRRREHEIVARRSRIRNPEHRFLMALLLNVERRADILQLVAARHPGVDPVDTVVRWVEELTNMPAPEGKQPNALGIRFDPSSLAVFRAMLRGRTGETLIAALADEHGTESIAAERANIAQLEQALARSALFRSLFSQAEGELP